MDISKEFKNWLDQYGRTLSERKQLEKREYIEGFDGLSLSEIISTTNSLLEKYGDVLYDEHWTGYEDMSPSVVWEEEEIDEEYEARIEDLYEQFLKEQEKEKESNEKLKDQLQKEIRSLKEKLKSIE